MNEQKKYKNFEEYFSETDGQMKRSEKFLRDLETYGRNYNSSQERIKYSKYIVNWLESSFNSACSK